MLDKLLSGMLSNVHEFFGVNKEYGLGAKRQQFISGGRSMKKNPKTVFICQECGHQVAKWMGKCPDCGKWDTLVEEISQERSKGFAGGRFEVSQNEPVSIDSIHMSDEYRLITGIGEFDRVLGGGLVPGSLVLIGGEPGIGKSTLMLQTLYGLAFKGSRVLYVSGEESINQITLRSKRLGTICPDFLVLSEVELDSILDMLEKVKPQVLVIDSIQTMFNSDLTSPPGSVSQVRESAMRLMLMSKIGRAHV